MALLYKQTPYTEQGRNLQLTSEQERTCKVLYRKTVTGLYKFAGFYDPDIPDEDYPDGIIVLPLRSTFGGTDTYNKGTGVWNVEGSSPDIWNGRKPQGGWYKIWEQKCPGQQKKCYVAGSLKTDGTTYCNNLIYGGHMIATSKQPNPGDSGKVFIIPICNAHNNRSNINEMYISEDVTGLILANYLS